MRNLREGLESGDLARGLVDTNVCVDRFKSKMGRDEDIVVLSFQVKGKDPSSDLMSFIEKGYNFILDSEISTGENTDGKYDVFVELARTDEVATQIQQVIEEVCNLTDNKPEDWTFTYRNSKDQQPLNVEGLEAVVPSTPEDYAEQYPTADIEDISGELDQLKSVAGLPIKSKAPKDADMDSIRAQAGLI